MVFLDNICYFRYTIKLTSKIGIPVAFMADNINLKLIHTETVSNKCFNAKITISALLIVIMLVQCKFCYQHSIQTPKSVQEDSYFDLFLALSILLILLICYIFVLSLKQKASIITSYINGHLRLDTKWTGKHVTIFVLERYTTLFCYMLPIYCLGSPFILVYGIHWFQPCKPSLIGYWLIDECRKFRSDNSVNFGGNTIISFTVKLTVF